MNKLSERISSGDISQEVVEAVAVALAPVRHRYVNDYRLKRPKVMAVDKMLAEAAITALLWALGE